MKLKLTPASVALGTVGLGIGVVAVLSLREATLTTHEDIDPDSRIELIVRARSKSGEPNQSLHEMVEAVMLACRLEVPSDLDGPVEDLGSGRFRATLTPSLDDSNRRQFRGCLEDWVVDHVLIDVLRLAEPVGT